MDFTGALNYVKRKLHRRGISDNNGRHNDVSLLPLAADELVQEYRCYFVPAHFPRFEANQVYTVVVKLGADEDAFHTAKRVVG